MSSSDELLKQYKCQLAAVEEALRNTPDDQKDELLGLKQKLKEVISLLQVNQEEPADSRENNAVTKNPSEEIDDEFLRFQMEINELEKCSDKGKKTDSCENSNDEKDMRESSEEAHYELCKVLSSMEGSKCRAPFARQWGERAYHNAIILSTDVDGTSDDLDDVQVKVMFCNPMCDEMKPCPFFLDGHCKFSSDKCRYSHGYSVKYSDLEEYVLPDYSNFQRDSKCLAKYKDGLWYTAVVENCLKGNKYFVKYNNSGRTETLAAYDVLPLENLALSDDDTSSDSSFEEAAINAEFESDNSELHVAQTEINYQVATGSSPLGSWEQHTKGIGSKLMAKMGYVWGQGLGKNSDGRIEPVEAVILPKGKSLDKCAEIREVVGPVSVEDRFNSEQAKEQNRIKKIEKDQSPVHTVFDFLNKNISGNADFGAKEDSLRKRRSSEAPSGPGKKSQNTDLNFEMFTVGEDIKKTRKEISKLQQSLNRNAERNEAACAQMKQKMALQNNLLRRLEAKEQRISQEINLRKGQKKIVTF